MVHTNQSPDERVLADLGERLARQRLVRNLTQDDLAREAGVSKRTVIRLESGKSSQMTNLIRVLRALGLLDQLIAVVPMPLPSPLEQLRSKRKERRRASSNSPKPDSPATWSWDDEPLHTHDKESDKSEGKGGSGGSGGNGGGET